jgi:hypothetical protein
MNLSEINEIDSSYFNRYLDAVNELYQELGEGHKITNRSFQDRIKLMLSEQINIFGKCEAAMDAFDAMAIKPIGHSLLKGTRTLLITALIEIMLNLMLAILAVVSSLNFFLGTFVYLYNRDFKKALNCAVLMVYYPVIAAVRIAIDLILIPASFITRPSATIYYLFSSSGEIKGTENSLTAEDNDMSLNNLKNK